MRSVGVKGSPNVRRRTVTRGALGLWWSVGRTAARRTVGRSHGFLPAQE